MRSKETSIVVNCLVCKKKYKISKNYEIAKKQMMRHLEEDLKRKKFKYLK